MSVRVVTDSTSCIPADLADRFGVGVVSLGVVFADGSAYRELDVDEDWFYKRLAAEQVLPTSSQPSPAELESAFEDAVVAGHDVVGVFISSDMSGTFASAELAARNVLERHPGARIELVDSRSNSMQLGMCALAAAGAAADGADVEHAASAARAIRARTRYLFTPATLENLRRGGRIGGASALLGTLLQIKPVLTVEDGQTQVFDKVRTRRRAIARIVEAFTADVEANGFADGYVHHIADEPEARELAATLAPIAGRELRIVSIDPVIGIHVGIGAVAFAYECERPLRSMEGVA